MGVLRTCKLARVNLGVVVSRLKKYSWRFSAAFVWLIIISRIFGFSDNMSKLVNFVGHIFYDYLGSINLMPNNYSIFISMLVVTWVLFIIGFKVNELFGFLIYILFSPITLFFALLFLYIKIKSRDPIKKQANPSFDSKKPLLTLSVRKMLAVMLALWTILYSDGIYKEQLLLGAAIAGLLFISLVLHAFINVRPLSLKEVPIIPRLEEFLKGTLDIIAKLDPPKSTVELHLQELMILPPAWLSRRIALLARGYKSRKIISSYVFFEFLLSLLVLGMLAVVFWSLTLKAFLLPSVISYSSIFSFVMAHFLPGIIAPAFPVDTPQWTHYGPSATFWVLFVLFIGPAASSLPTRQEMFLQRLDNARATLRNHALIIWRLLRLRRKQLKCIETTSKSEINE